MLSIAGQSHDSSGSRMAAMKVTNLFSSVIPAAKGSPKKKAAAIPAMTGPSKEKSVSTTGLGVETISDYPSFLGLESVWNRLVEEAGVDHPFLRHEWVRAWWESFGAGKTLHILVVKAGEEVIAIAPFMVNTTWKYGLPARRLEFISNVHTPRFDFIIARRREEACRAIWNCLLSQRTQWDVVELSEIPTDSQTLKDLPRLAVEASFVTGLWPSANAPYVPLTGTWDDYLKGLKGHHRSNIRNRLKRLEQIGEVRVELIASKEQLEGALEEGFRIEAAAWKSKTRTAINCHPDILGFYTALAERAAERGWLRLYFLCVKDRRIAFFYALCYANRLYVLKIGYDPNFASYSPCNVLTYLVLRNAFELGLAEYDILGVDDKWKLDWTNQVRPHCWLFVFSNNVRARLLHWAKFRLIPKLKQYRLYLSARDATLVVLTFLISMAAKKEPLGAVRKPETRKAGIRAPWRLRERVRPMAAAGR